MKTLRELRRRPTNTFDASLESRGLAGQRSPVIATESP